ncbi:MAG TPA: nitrate reductase cytochrome c-type subunit [Geminicoccaceae bacterium]|nr:nitrate reductase cytochrome c-type subunit [Geminicoccaceae bacterium]
MTRLWAAALGAVLLLIGAVSAAEVTGLRGPTPLTDEPSPPPLPREVNDDRRQARNYPEQPPVIPHAITDYRIDLRSNRCLTCHAFQFTATSGAPMISVTHFMDRDGQFLASVSPRRYFCTQCHVSQADVEPPIPNEFESIATLLSRPRQAN